MNYKKISVYLIAFGSLIIIAIYGISFLSSPEKLAFKELSRDLAELELQPEKNKLALFNEKIETVRKNYSDGKLVPRQNKFPPNPKKKFGIVFLSGKPRRNNWLPADKKLLE